MDFVCIDLETANADRSSICQIGIARFKDRKLVHEWKTYVDPEDYFAGYNVSIHGIDESVVKGSPKLTALYPILNDYLKNQVVVCHTHFDRTSIHQACRKYGIPVPNCTWLDSARVARRAWPEFSEEGYSLGILCRKLGYAFEHHDALEDAKAAGFVLIAASIKTGHDLEGLLKRVNRPINDQERNTSKRGQYEVNQEGPLFGEILVFTGALTIPRDMATKMAAQIGCTVADSVTKKTTILVVGDDDIRLKSGRELSTKHKKAEELIMKGQCIRILRESDFKELLNTK